MVGAMVESCTQKKKKKNYIAIMMFVTGPKA